MAEATFEKTLEDIKAAGRTRDYPRAVALCTELLSRTDQYPEALLFLGRSYHALGQYDRALSVFRFFLARKPDHPVGLFFLGRTYAAVGFYKKAVPVLKRVLEKDPGFAPALSFLGLASLKLKRPDQAIGYFERALQVEPQNPRIHSGYLNALLVQGIRHFYRKDLESAARVFEFLAGERPDDILPRIYLAVIAREMRNYPAALAYYDQALRLSPDDPVFHMHKADILKQMGRDEEVRRELGRAKGVNDEALAAAEDPHGLLKLIATTHFHNQRYREAIYFGKKVLKGDYRDVDMHIILAESYRFFGDLVKAKNHYLRAFDADRSRSDVFDGLAEVLWEKGDYPELLSFCRRRLHRHPDDAQALYYEALALSETDEAAADLIPLLQKQLRSHASDPDLMFSLGRAYADAGNLNPAAQWLERTLTAAPDHQETLLLLDEVYERLEKPGRQIEVLRKFCALFPDEIEYRKKHVRLLLQESRYGEAAAGLEKLIAREPANRSLRRALGTAYVKSKRYADAFLVWRELVTRDPTSIISLRQLIYCLAKMKRLAMAVRILEKAVRFLKKESSLLLPLGVLYARSREYEKANQTFRTLISLHPRDWRAYHNLGMLARRTGNKSLAENFLERARRYREESSRAASRPKKKPTP